MQKRVNRSYPFYQLFFAKGILYPSRKVIYPSTKSYPCLKKMIVNGASINIFYCSKELCKVFRSYTRRKDEGHSFIEEKVIPWYRLPWFRKMFKIIVYYFKEFISQVMNTFEIVRVYIREMF